MLEAEARGADTSLAPESGSFKQEPGSGVIGTVQGVPVCVGNWAWMQRQEVLVNEHANAGAPYFMKGHLVHQDESSTLGQDNGDAKESQQAGHTNIFVAVGGRLVGSIDVTDEVRPDARDLVHDLQKQGLRTVMVSGC